MTRQHLTVLQLQCCRLQLQNKKKGGHMFGQFIDFEKAPKVGELIKALSDVDPETPVFVAVPSEPNKPILTIEINENSLEGKWVEIIV